jgi:antitoxin FitA
MLNVNAFCIHMRYDACMATKHFQIRGMSEETINALRSRAAQEGLSATAFARRELEAIVSRPTMAELIQRADERRRRGVSVSTDDIVALQREMRGE